MTQEPIAADPTMLDVERLDPVLIAHVPDFAGIAELKKFNTGQSNPTFLVTDRNRRRFVLRAKPPGTLLKSAHQVDREYRVMNALAATPVPVPRMLYLADESASPIGRMFFVMEHLDGRIFWDPALPDVAREERGAIYDAMNAALASLHDVDPQAVGLSDFGRPGNYFERQWNRWSEQYRLSALDPIPDMDALIAWLGDHLPDDDGQISLVHGDYRIDNMIFAPDGPRILGVLDWELSTLGHPLSDLAYQCMQLRLPATSSFRGLGGLDRAALGIPSEADYVEAYRARRGLAPIEAWPFYIAFSFFRLGAILQGVLKRAVDGNASNPERARETGKAVPLLAGLAMDVVREADA
jgi:aminoglycoside phosphotransferase (APT) family kinase protein